MKRLKLNTTILCSVFPLRYAVATNITMYRKPSLAAVQGVKRIQVRDNYIDEQQNMDETPTICAVRFCISCVKFSFGMYIYSPKKVLCGSVCSTVKVQSIS